MPRVRNLPPLLAQAASRAGEGASVLFNRLDSTSTRHQHGAEVLSRLAEQLRAGAWSASIAELIDQAEAIERKLAAARVDGEH